MGGKERGKLSPLLFPSFLPRGVYSGWGIVVTVLVRPYVVRTSEIFFEIFVYPYHSIEHLEKFAGMKFWGGRDSLNFAGTNFCKWPDSYNFVGVIFTPRSLLRMGYCRQPTRTYVRTYVRPKNF